MAADDRLVRHPGAQGTSFTIAGRNLTGSDPRRSQRARLLNPGINLQPQSLYCVYSPLFGYGLEDFFSSIDDTSAILVVELDPRLSGLPDEPDSEVPYSCRVFRAATENEALTHAERIARRFGTRRVHAIHLSAGSRIHQRRYDRLTRTIEETIQRFWLNRATELRLNHRWVGNMLRNASLPAHPVAELGARIKPAVLLLGAGPGLDEHIGWLEEMSDSRKRDHFTIIAVDTALGTLAERGITPDVIWSMDAQLINARDFLPWRWDSVVLAADLSVSSSVLRRVRAENRYVFVTRYAEVGFFTDPALIQLTARYGLFQPRGSVAPSVIEFLIRYTQVKRVVTAGIEFWYRRPRTHARGSAIDRAFRRETTRFTRRDGFEESERRAMIPAVLDSNRSAPADRVLADHAAQFRALLGEPGASRIEWLRLPAPALPTGMRVVDPDEGRRLLTIPPRSSSGGLPSSPPPPTDRRAVLETLLTRLRLQERNVDAAVGDRSRRAYWDSGLDFVLRDLPQWPLMMVRREWFDLHLERVLPVLRDYRRRLERIVHMNDRNV